MRNEADQLNSVFQSTVQRLGAEKAVVFTVNDEFASVADCFGFSERDSNKLLSFDVKISGHPSAMESSFLVTSDDVASLNAAFAQIGMRILPSEIYSLSSTQICPLSVAPRCDILGFLWIRSSDREVMNTWLPTVLALLTRTIQTNQDIDVLSESQMFLMQARHTVIHHLSAARGTIGHLQPRWQRGLKNNEAWEQFRNDPIAQKSLSSAFGSLSEALRILENGRFQMGQIDRNSLSKGPFDILASISKSIILLTDSVQLKALTVKRVIRGTAPPTHMADGVLMDIAILNLIDNAVKYSSDGKQIIVEVEFGPASYVFSIKNTCRYTSKAQQELIMRVFGRSPQQSNLVQKRGTGLGLPITNKILNAHDPNAELHFSSTVFDPEMLGPANTFSFKVSYDPGSNGSSV